MEIKLGNTKETEKFAFAIAKHLKPGDVIALYGDLGSGKTTFVGFLAKALNSTKRVQSPTFVLMRKYECDFNGIKTINHLDLYRLTSEAETADLGITELLNEPNTLMVIEWPKIIEEHLPKKTIKLNFSHGEKNDSKRLVKVENVQNIY